MEAVVEAVVPALVELVFFAGCPHVAAAREQLAEALRRARISTPWVERDTTLADTPDAYRGFASPTVLVNGRDVRGLGTGDGQRCVVGGAPSVAEILRALEAGPAGHHQ